MKLEEAYLAGLWGQQLEERWAPSSGGCSTAHLRDRDSQESDGWR